MNVKIVWYPCLGFLFSLFLPQKTYSQSTPSDCNSCAVATTPSGPNYANQTLINHNFMAMGTNALVNANFQGATLTGSQFQNMNLQGANFKGATITNADFSGATLDHTCFQSADLTDANLQFAIFKATDLSCAHLIGAKFGPVMTIQSSPDNIRTRFNYTTVDFVNFPINNWPSTYWAMTDLSYTILSGMTSKNFNLKGKNITDGILKGINFTSFDLRHCTMTGVDLTNATLSYANMDSVLINLANLTNVVGQGLSMRGAVFYQSSDGQRGTNLSGGQFNNGADFSNADMQYTTLTGAYFAGASLRGVNFNYTNGQSGGIYNVANFTGAGMDNTTFMNASLNGVSFNNSYLQNAQFNNVTLATTDFSGATMPGANFQSSVLQGVKFTRAVLQNVNFQNTTFNVPPTGGAGVDLSCSQLGGANFANAIVYQVNFANAVMLAADSCCSTLSGTYCGTVSINGLAYGATVFPPLNGQKVTCPNGDYAVCAGSQWNIPNNWTTAGCSSPPQQQKMWYKPDCTGGTDTTASVTFADPKLKQCISLQLYNDPNKNISITTAAQVYQVSCPYQGISNLGGLEKFTALQQLDVSGNLLSDNGSFFSQLTSLQQLKVANNQLTGLSLNTLKTLNYVDASNNKITNNIAFNASAFINYLDLSHNQLSTFDISLQNKLFYVDLSYNKLNNILGTSSGLSCGSTLTTLYLENNSLTTIGDISSFYNNGLGKLRFLNLACNPSFQCNTLGLNSTNQNQQNFLQNSQCGQNSLPSCN